MVSQLDVAKSVGLSVSTVSRALRNDPVIPAATRTLVQAEAQRLGYRLNPLIAALMDQVRSRRSASPGSVIAYLDLAPDRREWETYAVTRAWYHSASARAAHLGYRLERIFPLCDGLGRATLTRMLSSRGISGVIVPVALRKDGRALESGDIPLDLAKFTVVTLGGEYTNPALHFAANDQFASARIARREIARLGYCRPGLVMEPALDFDLDHRFSAGFQSEPELPHPVPVLRAPDYAPELLEPWLECHKPDVVVSNFPYMLDWLLSTGRSIPEDVSFVCLDIDDSMMGVAGIDQRSGAIAEAAVDIVAARLQRNELGPPPLNRGLRIDGMWKDGPSAPPR